MIRKHFAGFAASALALAVSAQAFAGTVTTDGADIVVKTKGGLEVATTDKQFSFKVGGRIQADYSRFDDIYTVTGKSADAAYIRRGILEIGGFAFTDWKYQFNYDLSHNAGNSNDGYWDEASIQYSGIKPLNIKIGRFDPDFGLEKATSSKWVTALERNAAYDLVGWANGHEDGLGVQVNGTAGPSLYGSLGVHSKNPNDADGDSVKQFNARGVFAPMHEAGNVLHLGVNFSRRGVDDTALSATTSRLGMRGVKTQGGNFAGDNNGRRMTVVDASPVGAYDTDTAWGLEAAWAMGPLSVQGEYIRRNLDADLDAVSDVKAKGYYGQVAYTLTGEARDYKLGRFDQIRPNNKQIGAWEVYYRYDHLESDAELAISTVPSRDNKAKVHNLGVNWYLNDNVRLSGMYVKTKVKNQENTNGDDSGDGFVARAQYVF
jgi:phosphate-selective porin OprO/OprP